MEFPTLTAALQKKENIMKRIHIVLAAASLLVFAAGSAFAAASANGNATLTAKIGSKAVLSLGGTSITFDDTSNGTTVADMTASATSVTTQVRTNGSPASLTVTPDKYEFTSGTAKIPLSAITWTAGTGLTSGSFSGTALTAQTLSNTLAATAAPVVSDMTYKFTNSWLYTAGTYDTVTLNYVLSAP